MALDHDVQVTSGFETDEQHTMFEASILAVLQKEYDFQQRASSLASDTGYLIERWQKFADLGWLGLPMPEEFGGMGGDATDVGILMRSLGRHLVLEPVFSTVLLAARLIAKVGNDDQKAQELPAISAGQSRIALLHDEAADTGAPSPRKTLATATPHGWSITGQKVLGLGVPGAKKLIVSASIAGAGPDDLGLFMIAADAPGLQIEEYATVDGARAADVQLDAVQVNDDALLGGNKSAQGMLHRVLCEALIALSWEATGAMSSVFEQTVAYTQTRVQFGRATAKFQSVQHKLAEMAVCCTEARAACDLATRMLDQPGESAFAAASLAKSKVGRCARLVAQESVQLHGGMGVSEDLPVASYFRKLLAYQFCMGTTDFHTERYAQSVLANGTYRESVVLGSGQDVDKNDPAHAVGAVALSSKDEEFRAEVRSFLKENLTHELQVGQRLATSMFPEPDITVPWHKILARKGWTVPLWPGEWGGTGWTSVQRIIFENECALADAPVVQPMGPRLVGPVILKFGTEAQKKRYLPNIVEGNEYWCQGFSEPNAGSDLASLNLRATPDGDDYLLNGSKIWTTHAHFADTMFALVRTSSEGKPREGISFLLLDMKTPGIVVRPIITIGGDHDVNQVFFDNVRVPQSNRVGPENSGWDCAKYLLEFERGAGVYGGRLRANLKRVGRAVDRLEQTGINVTDKAGFLASFGEVVADLDVFEMLEFQTLGTLKNGKNPGALSSILKLRVSRLRQAIGALGMLTLGSHAIRWETDHEAPQPGAEPQPNDWMKTIVREYLNSRAYTIFGGASEIQLGIISKGVLEGS